MLALLPSEVENASVIVRNEFAQYFCARCGAIVYRFSKPCGFEA